MRALRAPGRLPVGPRADARLAAAVRARGDLRGARSDRAAARPPQLREELGDYLYEAVFLAQISEEAGDFSIARRHRRHLRQARPPASARLRARSTATSAITTGAGHRALGDDEGARARRRRAATATRPKTTLSGVPKTLPSLLRAYEISARAAAVGFDWARAERRARQDRRGGRRGPARGRVGRDRPPVARRGGDGRPALRDRQPVAQARHRAGGGAAARQREVHAAVRRRRAGLRRPRAIASGRDARGDGRRVAAGEGDCRDRTSHRQRRGGPRAGAGGRVMP